MLFWTRCTYILVQFEKSFYIAHTRELTGWPAENTYVYGKAWQKGGAIE